MSTGIQEHTCENCDNQFGGAFCNNCGQKVAHRITMHHIFHDMAHAFTHADKGFLKLLIQLFVRPGIVAREYIIENKRKKYFNPFQFILIIGSIAAFVAINTHFAETTMEMMRPGTGVSKRVLEFQHTMATYMTKYYNFLVLIQLPFFALGSFVVYRKYKYNYAEHLTLHTFITAQATLLGMLTMIFIGIIGKTGVYFSFFMALVTMIYQVLAFTQFFRERSVKGVLKGVVAYIVAYAFFLIFVILVMVAVIVVMVKMRK